jgi:hypothetical protein
MPERVSPLFTVCLTLRLAVVFGFDRLEEDTVFRDEEELTLVTPRLEDEPP